MLLKNAQLFDEEFELINADIEVRDEKIAAIETKIKENGESYDLTGCTIVPGFVETHIHGCIGFDVCDATREALSEMAGHLVTQGVTSFCPTTMTVGHDELIKILNTVKECMDNPPEGAAILGVNMEGPYISMQKKGAQKGEFVRNPDWDEFKSIYENCGGIVKLVDIAPECGNTDDFIANASKLCTVSIAHTEADYEQVKHAFEQGATHATHLYNAMTGFHHREPGAVGAVLESKSVCAELICDGLHIHPAVLRVTFAALGEDRTVIISDSMRGAGQPDGVSELGGQKVLIKNGQARLSDGTLAGSTTYILEEIKNLVRFGVPLKQVIKSATINPAKEIHEDDKIGSIKVGKQADLVVLDKDLNIKMVVAKGKIYPVK